MTEAAEKLIDEFECLPEQARSEVIAELVRRAALSPRFEAQVLVRFLRPGVFDAQNLITIPNAKLVRRHGSLASGHLDAVECPVRLWLGLSSGVS